MKRSMYSLILTDDVVAAIDALAAQQRTSRSNYINQVLAKHISFVTPEQQMQQMFTHLINQIEQRDTPFRIQAQGSDAMLSIFGAVQYKYHPTIRYRVEFLRDMHGDKIGELKISCRTQSQTLLNIMHTFFRFWVSCEAKTNTELSTQYTIQNGSLTKVLLRHGITEDKIVGKLIGSYIQTFHAILQSYFTGLQQGVSGAILQHVLERQYNAAREQQEQWL